MAYKGIRVAALLLLLAVALAYSNHFQNDFHFDDFHTVNNNPYIRSLRNAKLFFSDPATFSVLPANRTYRPLVTLSLAFDYWLGSGLKPFYFHLDMFLWYLVQLALMLALFRHILRFASTEPWTDWAALFAVALYGLHPAMAETVNYVIQRGDLYSTLLVVAALAFYALAPRLRRFGIYLLPLALALIAKQPAVIFPAILFAYVFLFEERRAGKALRRCVPSIVAVGLMLWLQTRMMPATFMPGIISEHDYLVTQPWVALHYFLMFFAPVGLTADTDQTAFGTIFCVEGIAGVAFLLALLGAIYAAAKRKELRPAAFGLAWFLLALIPTSVYRLSELENDHRMFLPFVGLAMAVSWCAALAMRRIHAEQADDDSAVRRADSGGVRLGNARAQWSVAQRGNALARCDDQEPAQRPRVDELRADADVQRPDTRGSELLRARSQVHAQLLHSGNQPGHRLRRPASGRGRRGALLPRHAACAGRRAAQLLLRPVAGDARTAARSPAAIPGRDCPQPGLPGPALCADAGLLGCRNAVGGERDRGGYLQNGATGDVTALRFLNGQAVAEALPDPSAVAEALVKLAPTADNYLNLSLAYDRAGRFRDCIQAAEQALKLRPGFALAYNNIAAAHMDLGEWDAAIAATPPKRCACSRIFNWREIIWRPRSSKRS